MSDFFTSLADCGAQRVLVVNDEASGLRALIALDDFTLGPACGGIRTLPYATMSAALGDVAKLSAAMTLKCAIAGLAAGGGKAVVIEHPSMDRAAAFRRLGDFIEDLGGLYRTAGDLGTSHQDLLWVAERTAYVNTSGVRLGEAAGEGIVHCILACARDRGLVDLRGLRIGVQGCGLIGAGVARSMAKHGARVIVADVDDERARNLAAEIGGDWLPSDDILSADADIISPCAIGGVLTPASVADIRAWGVCGGANNQLSDPSVDELLARRGIAYVPDFLASSGAVIDGIARTVMNIDPAPLLAGLEEMARSILQTASVEGRGTDAVGREIAYRRIATARREARSLRSVSG
jgi:leucine dehydrogenase